MDDVLVTVNEGRLRGKQNYSEFARVHYFSFCGIPYAVPPVGDLRFRPPIPVECWNGIRDAISEADACIQYVPTRKELIGSEDCLYLNIHTMEAPSKVTSPKAVLLLIHPGGHTWGSGNVGEMGAPDYLLNRDIIYVTINYRLSVFGFLNFMTPECLGNAGIKDIILALKWIKQNIKYFGGDPSNITAIGNSAGASIIHLLSCSPKSKGLINKAILQGCHGTCTTCFQENPLKMSFTYARSMGYTGNDKQEAVKFLKSIPAIDLLNGLRNLRVTFSERIHGILEITHFHPSIEIMHSDAFLFQDIHEFVMSVEPIPVLYSACGKEGMFILSGNPFPALNNDFENTVRRNLWMYKINSKTLTEISKKIRYFYFKDRTVIDEQCINQVIDLYTDFWTADVYQKFINPIHKKDPNVPVYMFQFLFNGSMNVGQVESCIYLKLKGITLDGACHADELAYYCQNRQFTPTENDLIAINRLCTFFINFAIRSDPNDAKMNIFWPRTTLKDPCYLQLADDMKIINKRINEERVQFWEQIYEYIDANSV